MAEIKIDYSLDLRGVSCPMNFVKTKLKLEEICPKEVLEILLDDGDPIKNVASSIKEEGQVILKIEQRGTYWRLIVRKSGEDG